MEQDEYLPIINECQDGAELSMFQDTANEDDLQQGIQLFDNGNYTEAIESFSRILGRGENETALRYLARSYFRLDQFSAALRHYETLALSSKYRESALSMIASIHAIFGDYEKSLKILAELPLKPNNISNRLNIYFFIVKYHEQNQYLKDALAVAEQIDNLELTKFNKSLFYQSRGMIKQLLKDYSQAKIDFKRALAIASDSLAKARILDELGSLYLEILDIKKAGVAIDTARRYIDQDNTNNLEKGYNYRLLGLLELKKNNIAIAERHLQQALLIFEIKNAHAESYETRKIIKNLTESSSQNEDIFYQEYWRKAVTLFERQNYLEAIEYFSVILGRKEDDLARQYLARCYFKLGMRAKTKEHCEILSNSHSSSISDYGKSMLAFMEVDNGDINRAIRILRQLPHNTQNLLNVAFLYYKQYLLKNSETSLWQSLNILKKIHLQNKSKGVSRRIYHLLGLIYQEFQDYRVAESHLSKALDYADNNLSQMRIINDLAGLYVRQNDNDARQRAIQLLLTARTLVDKDTDYVQKGMNSKLLGIMAVEEGDYELASKYLEESSRILTDKKLIQEAAEVNFYLATVHDEDFNYKLLDESFCLAVRYYAKGMFLEGLIKDIEEKDQRFYDFIEDNFFGD